MRRIVSIVAGLAALALADPGALVAQDNPTTFPSNRLRAGDELLLRVWPDTTLSGRFRIESNGQAYFPLVGSVQAEGRTAEDLRDELVDRFGRVMQSPVVVVTPRFQVALLGGVNGPGLHWVEPTTTLFDLIVQTGGLTDRAKPSEMVLLRQDQRYTVDIEAALEENRPTAAVPLHSGDRILVPESADVRGIFTGIRFAVQTATLVFTVLNFVN